MKPHLVRVATPTYEGRVTNQHAIGLVRLACDLMAVERWQLEAIQQATEHLIPARNELLAHALASRADVLLWLDADNALAYQDPETVWSWFAEALDDDVAIVGTRYARRDGKGFALVDDETVTDLDRNGPLPYGVRSCGLGACLYNLSWWRKRAAEFPGFEWRKLDAADLHASGEDYSACAWARGVGGKVRVDPLVPVWHAGVVVEPSVKRKVIVARH